MGLHLLRRAVQLGFIALVFSLPVFDILRYDVASKELYLFGSPWSLGLKEGFYLDRSLSGSAHIAVRFLLNAILPWLIALSIFPLFGFLLGRFFCGWLCPEGAIFEYADFITLKLIGRKDLFSSTYEAKPRNRALWGAVSVFSLILIPPVFGVFLSGYFIAPASIFNQIKTLELSSGLKAGIIGVWAYMAVTSILVRHRLCKYVCAAGLMQMLFGWISPTALRVKFDAENISLCTNCRGCEKACFMGVNPRLSNRDINCVNCGQCISACNKELGKGLFSYCFGADGRGLKSDRALSKERLGLRA